MPALQTGFAYLLIAKGGAADRGAGAAVAVSVTVSAVVEGGATDAVGVEA